MHREDPRTMRILRPLTAALLLGTFIAAAASAADDRIPRAVVNLVNENIQGVLRVSTMSFSVPDQVTLGAVELRDPAGGLVARADRITTRVDLKALALGELALSELELVRPERRGPVRGGRA